MKFSSWVVLATLALVSAGTPSRAQAPQPAAGSRAVGVIAPVDPPRVATLKAIPTR